MTTTLSFAALGLCDQQWNRPLLSFFAVCHVVLMHLMFVTENPVWTREQWGVQTRTSSSALTCSSFRWMESWSWAFSGSGSGYDTSAVSGIDLLTATVLLLSFCPSLSLQTGSLTHLNDSCLTTLTYVRNFTGSLRRPVWIAWRNFLFINSGS